MGLEAGLSDGTGGPLVADPANVGAGDDVEGLKVALHAAGEAGLLLARQTGARSGDALEVALLGRFCNELLRVGHGQFGRPTQPSISISNICQVKQRAVWCQCQCRCQRVPQLVLDEGKGGG